MTDRVDVRGARPGARAARPRGPVAARVPPAAGADVPPQPWSQLPAAPPVTQASTPGAERGDARGRRADAARGAWFVDLVIALVAAFLALVVLDDAQRQLEPLSRRDELLLLVELVAGGLGCLALLWRRRWPVALAVPTIASTAVLATPNPAALVLLYTVVVLAGRTAATWLTGLVVAAGATYHALRPDPGIPYSFLLLLTVLVAGATVAVGLYARTRRLLVVHLEERARRAEEEQQHRVEEARRLERTRIAREMHDVLAHRLALLSLSAGALEFRPDAPPAQVSQAAGVVRDSAHRALEELRTVIGVLREGPDEAGTRPQPTLRELPALVEESRAAGMRVELRFDVTAAVADGLGRAGYRVVQEGLTNAGKHAPGTRVTVTVEGGPEHGLHVEVANPAPVGPRRPVPGSGTGLTGLAERVALAGGSLLHGPTDDGGFRLVADLPAVGA